MHAARRAAVGSAGEVRSTYRRREPGKTILHDLVSRYLEPVLQHARDKSAHGFGYPRFVEREFQRFLDCGLLRRGFVRVRCTACPNDKLVAFSCKGRGICPSCTARRMASAAAHLVDRVLPAVPYRQWVMSFPKRVRFALARDPKLLSEVLDLCLKKIFAWQRRRARACGLSDPLTGAVTFVQRFGSLLNLNCHFHSLLPDGVFVETAGQVEFVPLLPPWPEDIDRLVQQIARATDKRIALRAQSRADDDAPELLEREQAQSLMQSSFPPRPRPGGPPRPSHKRCAFFAGYSLHADRRIDAHDRDGLERLCRYGARAPIANSRLSLDDHGDAVITLNKPLHDGRTQLTFTPPELLQKLAILIPPPKKNLTRYHGVFAPAHRHRAKIVPPADAVVARKSPYRLPWADLLRRVFAIDILKCDRCAAPMTIVAVITQPDVIDKILDHLGLPDATGPPSPGATDR